MIAALLLALAAAAPAPPPPLPELTAMEPAVAQALRRSRDAVLAAPDDAEAWAGHGATLLAHDLRDGAVRCFERARELAPERFEWSYLLALAGGGDDAWSAAAGLRDDYGPLWLRWGLELSRQGRHEEALERFRRAAALEPGSARARRQLGQSLAALGRDDAAVAALQRAAALDPRDGAVFSTLARVEMRAGHEDRARSAAARARRLQPRNDLHDPLFARLVEARGASTWHRLDRARRELGRGAWREAAAALEPLRAELPGEADLPYLLARAARGAGNPDRARALLDEALALQPDHVRALLERAELAASRGDGAAALADYRRARELSPYDPTPLVGMARVFEAAGDRKGLIEVYRALVELAPEEPRLRAALDRLLAEPDSTPDE